MTPDATCREILAGVSAYLDGELDAADCERIERHSRTCASCATVVAGLRETIGLCRGASHAPLPDAVTRQGSREHRQPARSVIRRPTL